MQGSVAADSIHSSEHNLDIDGYRKSLKNVDYSRTHLNEIFIAKGLRDLYDECFGDAVKAYNDTQKRSDRKIKDYYDKISKSKQEKLAYEIVIQLGDRDNNPAKDMDERQREAMTLIYKDYLDRFQERWGHVLRVFEAAVHYDEATPHMHIAYVPVAHNTGKKGLSIKNSQRQAMQELGYYVGSVGERTDFYHDAQDMLTEVMLDHGLTRDASRYDRAGRGDMTWEEYVEFSKNQEKIIATREELAQISQLTEKEITSHYRRQKSLAAKRNTLNRSVGRLQAQQSSLKRTTCNMMATKRNLTAEVVELRSEVAQTLDALTFVRDRVEQEKEILSTVHDELVSEAGKLDSVTAEISSRRAELSSLDSIIIENRDKVAELQGKVLEAADEVATLQMKAISLKRDNNALETTRDALKGEISAMKEEKGVIERAIEILRETLDALIEKISEYMPDPIKRLVEFWRDGDYVEVDRWHSKMDAAAIDVMHKFELEDSFSKAALEKATAASLDQQRNVFWGDEPSKKGRGSSDSFEI